MLKLLQKIKITRDCFNQENSLKCNTSMHKAYSSLFCTVLHSPIKVFATCSLQDSSSPLPHHEKVDYEYTLQNCVWKMVMTSLMFLLVITKAGQAKLVKSFNITASFSKPNKKNKQANKNIKQKNQTTVQTLCKV